VQGWFSPMQINPAPLGKRIRDPMVSFVNSGNPLTSILAPNHSGRTDSTPNFSAILSNSSTVTIVIWRRLRISVHLGYIGCLESALLVIPKWRSPRIPPNSRFACGILLVTNVLESSAIYTALIFADTFFKKKTPFHTNISPKQYLTT
jgi:hypothetical protein